MCFKDKWKAVQAIAIMLAGMYLIYWLHEPIPCNQQEMKVRNLVAWHEACTNGRGQACVETSTNRLKRFFGSDKKGIYIVVPGEPNIEKLIKAETIIQNSNENVNINSSR